MLQSDPGHHASDGNRRKGCTRPQPQPPSHTPASQDKKAVLTSRETAGCDSDHTVRRLSYSAINIEPVKAQLEPRSSNEDSKQSSCTCLALERRVWMDACARHQWSRGQQVSISAANFKKRQSARAPRRARRGTASRAHPSGAPAPPDHTAPDGQKTGIIAAGQNRMVFHRWAPAPCVGNSSATGSAAGAAAGRKTGERRLADCNRIRIPTRS